MTEFDEDNLLTEVFNLGSAKGYPFTISAPGEYPADPAITFQTVFKDDHGTEFAFRVYKANLIQGTGQRKYGKHTRVLAFMRRKTKNFAQNITLDAGTFKKVLVTFMQSYEAYKDTKDGQLASSYAIILQAAIKNYASLFVRATVRAFKANRKLHMSLYGVQEDGIGGSIELLYVNPQTIYPYWGGPEFDEAKFVGNPTHVALAKLEGTTIAPAGGLSPVDAAATSNTGAVSVASTDPQAAVTPPAVAVALPDPMNNPGAFNETLFNRLHYAKGRDDFAEILREFRVHRKYMQEHFATLFNALYVNKPLEQVFDKVNMANWEAGMGFYLKRYDSDSHAYIRVFMAARDGNVDAMINQLSSMSNEISTLKSGVGKVKTGGVIADLLTSIRDRVRKESIERLTDIDTNTNFKLVKSDLIKMNTSFDNTGLGVGLTSIASYLQRANIPVASDDIVQAMTLLYFFDVATAGMLIDVIQSYEPNAGATITNTAFIVRRYDSLFTDSTTIIDRLLVLFPTKTSVTFGAAAAVEDRLVNLFLTNMNRFSREVNDAASYDAAELSRKLVATIATLDRDYFEKTFEDFMSDMILGYQVHDMLKLAVKSAYVQYVVNLPVTERLSDRSEERLLQYFNNKRYGSTTGGSAATDYFMKRPEVFYDLWLGKGISYGTNVTDIKSIVPNFDIGAYWTRVKQRFLIPGSQDAREFVNAILSVSITPLMSVDQLIDVVKSGFITAEQLQGLYSKGAKNAPEAYRKLGGTLHSYLSAQKLQYNFVDKVDFVKEMYDVATPGEKIAAQDRLLNFISIGLVEQVFDIVGQDVVDKFVTANPSAMAGVVNSQSNKLFKVIGSKAADVIIADMPNYFSDLSMASGIIAGLDNGDKWDGLSLESVKTLFRLNNRYIRSAKPAVRAEYEAANSKFIIEAWKKDSTVGEDLFTSLDVAERKLVAKGVLTAKFVKSTREELAGDAVPIKPMMDLDEARINQILKYNDIKVPRAPQVKDDTTLTDLMSKVVDKADINKLAVTAEDKTPEELEKMSVEYDAFNRYRHGNIAVKIIRSFNVSIPVQEAGFAAWQAKMAAEGTDSKVMRPVFHGTGSVAASMILRYGFKVIKSSDSSVVGRMLGDGIYFSNVIDKVSQYMSDGGYSRGVGIKGYIFEMEASLGKYRRDFNAAGPGTGYDTTRVISPEWAVFNANDQLRIYKAYQCELIDKSTMDVLKAKQGVNETTSVIGIQHFKGFVNEAIGDKMKNKVVYIFMDGTIPVSKHKSVDFEDFDPTKYGKHVQTDWSGSGPTVQIDTNGPGGVFCVRYTNQLMHDAAKLEKFIDLLNGN